jgi:hypothetical protein
MTQPLNFIPRRNSALVPPPPPCTAPAPMYSTRSCAELGLCQGCDWLTSRPWAPGTIDGPFTRTGIAQRFQRLAWYWVPRLILGGCTLLTLLWLAAIIGFVLGYTNPNFSLIGTVRRWFR